MAPTVGQVIKELSEAMDRINKKIGDIDSEDKKTHDSEMQELEEIKGKIKKVKKCERNGINKTS